MEPIEFEKRNCGYVKRMAADLDLIKLTRQWFSESSRYEYSYHFTWLGRPIIQFPQDMIAMQEIIWNVKPDLIIETGIARGGSLIFYASMLELLGRDGQVIGIDNDIRDYNREGIEKHPMYDRITMIEGSSISEEVIEKVYKLAEGKGQVLVALDSNHTHDHVFKELQLYSPLVTRGSYLIVFDTIIEFMPDEFSANCPWGKGNNPYTAVQKLLKTNHRFEIDKEIEQKLLITVAPHGYLKCVKDGF